MFAHRENRIQHQHTLLCPLGKLSVMRGNEPDIVGKFPKNIFQGRRRGDAFQNGEAKPVRLVRPVIRILSKYHCPRVFKRCISKRIENIIHIRIHNAFSVFIGQELPQIPVVVFLKFVFKNFVPIVAEIYHLSSVFCCVLHKINILFCFAQMPSIAEAIAK